MHSGVIDDVNEQAKCIHAPKRYNFPPPAGEAATACADLGPGHVGETNLRHSSYGHVQHCYIPVKDRYIPSRGNNGRRRYRSTADDELGQAKGVGETLTAFPSSLKNSPPMHQRWLPLGHGVRVALARRLGGPSTSSSVTLCASSHSL